MWDLKWWGSLALWFLERKIQGPQGTIIQKPVGEAPSAGFLSGEKKMGLRLGFFVFFSECCPNYPPLNVLRNLVFIGKMLLGFSTWSFNFFLFVNFDFSYFFENEQYQRRLNEENQ